MPKDTKAFSILIPTWNNLPYLRCCIRSLRRHSRLANQWIVLVNEGIDGTLEWAKEQPDLECVHFRRNEGICTALNAGARKAAHDLLVYMNDDMYALPDWDGVLMAEIEAIGHERFFLSATMIEPLATGNNCVIVRNFGTDLDSFQEEKLLHEFSGLPKEDWNGATWPPNVVHRTLWDRIGGMSCEFSPGMYSDPDLAMKLWRAGVRIFKGIGGSRVYHFGAKSTSKLGRNEGQKIFLKKWGLTAGTFSKYYLRRGTRFNGPLPDARLGPFVHLQNKVKKTVGKVLGNMHDS